jgi:hypothetical protein
VHRPGTKNTRLGQARTNALRQSVMRQMPRPPLDPKDRDWLNRGGRGQPRFRPGGGRGAPRFPGGFGRRPVAGPGVRSFGGGLGGALAPSVLDFLQPRIQQGLGGRPPMMIPQARPPEPRFPVEPQGPDELSEIYHPVMAPSPEQLPVGGEQSLPGPSAPIGGPTQVSGAGALSLIPLGGGQFIDMNTGIIHGLGNFGAPTGRFGVS